VTALTTTCARSAEPGIGRGRRAPPGPSRTRLGSTPTAGSVSCARRARRRRRHCECTGLGIHREHVADSGRAAPPLRPPHGRCIAAWARRTALGETSVSPNDPARRAAAQRVLADGQRAGKSVVLAAGSVRDRRREENVGARRRQPGAARPPRRWSVDSGRCGRAARRPDRAAAARRPRPPASEVGQRGEVRHRASGAERRRMTRLPTSRSCTDEYEPQQRGNRFRCAGCQTSRRRPGVAAAPTGRRRPISPRAPKASALTTSLPRLHSPVEATRSGRPPRRRRRQARIVPACCPGCCRRGWTPRSRPRRRHRALGVVHARIPLSMSGPSHWLRSHSSRPIRGGGVCIHSP